MYPLKHLCFDSYSNFWCTCQYYSERCIKLLYYKFYSSFSQQICLCIRAFPKEIMFVFCSMNKQQILSWSPSKPSSDEPATASMSLISIFFSSKNMIHLDLKSLVEEILCLAFVWGGTSCFDFLIFEIMEYWDAAVLVITCTQWRKVSEIVLSHIKIQNDYDLLKHVCFLLVYTTLVVYISIH